MNLDHIPHNPGVYEITCTQTDDRYIGASKDLRMRAESHLNQLRGSGHAIEKLQSLFDVYGAESFVFDVLCITGSINEAFDYERAAIRSRKPSLNTVAICERPAQPLPRPGLTRTQEKVLKVIAAYQAANEGVSPTMQWIADEMNVSKVTIFEHINELQRKGWLTRDANQSRSLRLTAQACPCCGRVLDEALASAIAS
jgi:excinuclease UvrABC nuclease subunit